MTPEQYIDILVQHGRRVANRVVLADMSLAKRTLSDFYACYGSELLLERQSEVCQTNMARLFDPTGWFVYYPDDVEVPLWPETLDGTDEDTDTEDDIGGQPSPG